ncbi:hypothetical protein ACHWQZ_G010816 [Mnemiopsis leidyi]
MFERGLRGSQRRKGILSIGLFQSETIDQMGLTHSSSTNLRNLLTKTKTTPPSELTPTIYEIFCLDYSSTYNGQTYRPLIHRMKEHERCHRLNNAYDETLDKKLCPCSLLPHHWTQSSLERHQHPRNPSIQIPL